MNDERTPGRRMAKTLLPMHVLEQFLRLPDGLRVVACQGVTDPPGVYVVVEGEALPEQSYNCELPTFWGNWQVNSGMVQKATVEEIAAELPAPVLR